MGLFGLFGSNFAIDLGTSNTLVYVSKTGEILSEASCVAIDIRNGDVVAVGNKAQDMFGKTPEHIAILRPLEDGKISDFDVTKILLKYCFDKALNSFNLVQPKVVVTAPVSVSDIEMRAIEDACISCGAREVYIIESAVASAIGGGIDVTTPEGNLIVDLGAGNSEIAIVSLSGIVISKFLNFGGDNFDTDIMDYIFEKYKLNIGKQSAKFLKENIGNLIESADNKALEVSGRDVLSGMPITKTVFESDIREAIIVNIHQIIDAIKNVLEKNPSELSRDILNNGIYLTGGSSLLENLDTLIENELGIKVRKSDTPLTDAVKGAGEVLNNINKYKNYGK